MSARTRGLGAALLAAALLTSGCAQLLSINEQALVVGVGLDAGSAPGQVRASLQWFHHGNPGGSRGSNTSDKVFTVAAAAAGVAGAVAGVAAQVDQRITFAATGLVVLSEVLARHGVATPLDYFWRDHDFSETAEIAVASGNAGQLLERPFPGGTALEMQRRLVRSQGSDTGSIPIPMWRFLARAASAGEAAWAPVFAATPGGFVADGTALFQGDRLTGVVSQAETAPLSWLLKPGGFGDLTLPALSGPDGEPTVLSVISRDLRRRVAGDRAEIDLTLLADVSQGPGISLRRRDPTILKDDAERQAEADVEGVVRAMQAAGSDVLGLGELVRERDPGAVADWPRTFSHLRIDVSVTVHVIPSGRGA